MGMHRQIHALAFGLLAAAALAASPPSARADAYKDEKLGFSLSYPSKWDRMPLAAGDWVVAKFNCNREYEWVDSKDNWYVSHRPFLDVVIIPRSVAKDRGAIVEETAKGIKVTESAPWTNLKEYLDKTYQRREGGFHFSAEEEGTVNSMKVRMYEITIDKLVRGEKRVFGWEFETEDAFYGLVAEILIQEEKKLKPLVLQSFKTFQTFPRTGVLPNSARTGEEIVTKGGEDSSTKEISPEEMRKERELEFERTLSRIKETLSRDWNIMEGRHYVAVTHTDARYTRDLLMHAEALRAWLEKEMGFIGSGYVGKVIIRICADNEEQSAYLNSRGWSASTREIVTYRDKSGWSDWAMQWMNQRIFDEWVRDKNDRLLWGAPRWITYGLDSFIGGARVKGGKVEFKFDSWESVEMKNIRRAENLIQVKDFFTLTGDELWSDQRQSWRQTPFFVRFLLTGSASRSGHFRNVFSDYVKNLIFLLDMESLDSKVEELAKKPESEEEENELFRKRQDMWKAREREHLQKLMEKTFGDWTDRDWAAFDALYRKDLK